MCWTFVPNLSIRHQICIRNSKENRLKLQHHYVGGKGANHPNLGYMRLLSWFLRPDRFGEPRPSLSGRHEIWSKKRPWFVGTSTNWWRWWWQEQGCPYLCERLNAVLPGNKTTPKYSSLPCGATIPVRSSPFNQDPIPIENVVTRPATFLPARRWQWPLRLPSFISRTFSQASTLRVNSVGNMMALSRATGSPLCLPRSMTTQMTNFEKVLIAPESE
jgi:hypothetical protein